MTADTVWSWLQALRDAARTGAATRPERPAIDPLDQQAQSLALLLERFAAAGPGSPFALGQIGQSLDGRIATMSGDSHYVTGHENRCHLHRIRALADAVVVGAGTVVADDPRLTTRHVDGPNPVRVVIDPSRRVPADRGLFRDGAAPTLVLCRPEHADRAAGTAEMVPLADLSPPSILAALGRRGLHAVFVEGGGITISRFIASRALDALHVAVAPILVGPGRPSFDLPPIASLAAAIRPPCRAWPMGADVLFELDLRAPRRPS
jgi:diaminohydroxyphosphoribosylaminopyrimidine deaminase/5-amino-6-(5-phosphoribosylamino)uracil reductase